MTVLGRVVSATLGSLASMVLVWGCGTNGSEPVNTGGNGGGNGLADSGSDAIYTPDVRGADSGDGAVIANPLCGALVCVPDDPRSCSEFVPPVVPGDAGAGGSGQAGAAGSAGEGGLAGRAGDTGSGGSSGSSGRGGSSGSGGASGRGGSSGGGGVSGGGGTSGGLGAVAGEGGAAGDGGGAGEAGTVGTGGGPGTEPAIYGCRVQRKGAGVASACEAAGNGELNAPCFSSSDCQPGLGCVGDGSCRPFCCQDEDSCPRGTYCAERTLREEPATSGSPLAPLLVPTCMPADNCDLAQAYPCPAGGDCRCPSGTACMVVRPDGTTTCAVPGAGLVGQACPCAWGHVCSRATNTCLKLCNTLATVSDCGSGKCQASAELPEGFGVCVGMTTLDAG
jgi:hypothetical protein